MKEFFEIIFGAMSAGQWLAYLLLAVLGTVLFTWMEVDQRDVASPRTPKSFSWSFLARDNIRRYILTLLLIFVQMRFFKDINGVDLTPYMAIVLGFGSDGIAGFSKRKIKRLQADRERLLKADDGSE
jgi:hypothetical protein